MIQSGYFLITDISGYTQFLTASELEHANAIIHSLLDLQLANISSPFNVSRFQGDAIQTYAIGTDLLRPQMILEMVETLYYEFRDHVRQADFNTSCNCAACSNIKNLELKIIVHHGEFLIQAIGSQEELQGREVIVAHRLEKNTIKETHNLDAYAIFTQAAIEAAHMGDMTSSMIPHAEEYEHLGRVEVFVYDLQKAWKHEQNRRRSYVDKETAWAYSKVEVPISKALAWDRATDRKSKLEYIGLNELEQMDLQDGRIKEESKYHCSHDLGDFKYTIIDWSPFDYYTAQEAAFGLKYRKTYRLTELAKDRTLFELIFETPEVNESSTPLEEWQPQYQAILESVTTGFAKLIDKQLKSGEISPQTNH